MKKIIYIALLILTSITNALAQVDTVQYKLEQKDTAQQYRIESTTPRYQAIGVFNGRNLYTDVQNWKIVDAETLNNVITITGNFPVSMTVHNGKLYVCRRGYETLVYSSINQLPRTLSISNLPNNLRPDKIEFIPNTNDAYVSTRFNSNNSNHYDGHLSLIRFSDDFTASRVVSNTISFRSDSQGVPPNDFVFDDNFIYVTSNQNTRKGNIIVLNRTNLAEVTRCEILGFNPRIIKLNATKDKLIMSMDDGVLSGTVSAENGRIRTVLLSSILGNVCCPDFKDIHVPIDAMPCSNNGNFLTRNFLADFVLNSNSIAPLLTSGNCIFSVPYNPVAEPPKPYANIIPITESKAPSSQINVQFNIFNSVPSSSNIVKIGIRQEYFNAQNIIQDRVDLPTRTYSSVQTHYTYPITIPSTHTAGRYEYSIIYFNEDRGCTAIGTDKHIVNISGTLSIVLSNFIPTDCHGSGTMAYVVSGGNNNSVTVTNSIPNTIGNNGRTGRVTIAPFLNTITATQQGSNSGTATYTPNQVNFQLSFTNFVSNGAGGGTITYSALGGSANGGAITVGWTGYPSNPPSGTAVITGETIFTVTQNGCTQNITYTPPIITPGTLSIVLSNFIPTDCHGSGTMAYVVSGGNNNSVTVTNSIPNTIGNNGRTGRVTIAPFLNTITATQQGSNSGTATYTSNSTQPLSIFFTNFVSNIHGGGTVTYQVGGGNGTPLTVNWTGIVSGSSTATSATINVGVGITTFNISQFACNSGPLSFNTMNCSVSNSFTPICGGGGLGILVVTSVVQSTEICTVRVGSTIVGTGRLPLSLLINDPGNNISVSFGGCFHPTSHVWRNPPVPPSVDGTLIPNCTTGLRTLNLTTNIIGSYQIEYQLAIGGNISNVGTLPNLYSLSTTPTTIIIPPGIGDFNAIRVKTATCPPSSWKYFTSIISTTPNLPSPTIQLNANCGTVFTGELSLDPLICQIQPSEWEIVGVNTAGDNTVLQTITNFTTTTSTLCKTAININTSTYIERLFLRHKLTTCSTPIIIPGGGFGGTHKIQKSTDFCISGYYLTAPAGYDTYLWSPNNETTQSILVEQIGTYSVQYSRSADNCTGTLSQLVDIIPPPPVFTVTVTPTTCMSADLKAIAGFDSYIWYNSFGDEIAQSQDMLAVVIEDTYRVVATKGTCVEELEVSLNFLDLQVFAYPNADCSAYELVANTGFDSYLWSNGATTESITVNADGVYTVETKIGSCTQTATVHVDYSKGMISLTLNLPSLSLPNVLATSASTFSEQWLQTGGITNISSLESGFGNGQRGIWKPHETYAYVSPRQRAMAGTEFVTPNLKQDGVFDLNMFNWKYYGVLTCSEWLRTQHITQYSSANFEIENKDILDRYTSALYGYKKQLPIATAGNARVNEIAYESFEEYTNSPWITTNDILSNDNNLDLITNSSTDAIQAYHWLPVEIGLPKTNGEYMVYTKGKVFTGATVFPMTNVLIKGYNLDKDNPGTFIWRVAITSFKEVGEFTELILTTTDNTNAPTHYWKGEIGITKNTNLSVQLTSTITLQNIERHTGKNAIKIERNTNDELFRIIPKRMHFIRGKKYIISAWVKLANTTTQQQTRKMEYIDKVFFVGALSSNRNVYSDVIEGWVRIEQEFEASSEQVQIMLINKNDNYGILYVDDIRIQPFNSSLQTYVYDPQNYKLRATLDGNNFASLYYYDEQGNLQLTKKETERGIQTIQEAISHQPKQR
jgi:hypothetical protein